MVDSSSFLLSLSTYLALFLLLSLFFFLLSPLPSNAVIFFSGRLLRGLSPPNRTESTRTERGCTDFTVKSWMSLGESVRTGEGELVQLAGLDAATYTKMHIMCLKIMLWASIFCIPILLPINFSGTLYESNTAVSQDTIFHYFDKFSIGNINLKSHSLWAHAVGAWWLSIGAYYFLYTTFKSVSKLRNQSQSNEVPEPSQLAVLVRDIPKPKGKSTPKELIDGFFGKAHGKAFIGSILLPRMGNALAIYAKLQKSKRQLSHSKALLELSKTELNPSGIRPSHKTGFLGLFGTRTDSIECYKDKIEELVHQLSTEQEKITKDEYVPSAIVLFRTRTAASSASQALHNLRGDRWQVMGAPEPSDIVWENVTVTMVERHVRSLGIYLVVALTILFYMIPITFVSGLTTLSNLEETLPSLKHITQHAALKTILEAFLPQIFLMIFLGILPYLLDFLSYWEGLPSKSQIVRASTGKYYYFIIINVFLGVSLSGGVYIALQEIIDRPRDILKLLGSSIPAVASFFFTYLSLSFFLVQGLQISQIVRYVTYKISLRYFCKTEDELRNAWNPGGIPYSTAVPFDLLAITLGLCYAIVAPSIVLVTVLYHFVTWVVMKHQALNVYFDEYQSGGRMFPQIHTRIVVGLLISQLTLIGVFGLKEFVGSVTLIPLPILTILYYRYTYARFYKSFLFNSLDVGTEDESTESFINAEELERLYTPPCLKKDNGEMDFLSVPLIGNVRQMAISGIRSDSMTHSTHM